MGTRLDDWAAVEELSRAAPRKVIPCFGVHPWYAHLHALTAEQVAHPTTLLEPPPPPKGNDRPNDSNRPTAATTTPPNDPKPPEPRPLLPALPPPSPPEAWLGRLRALLLRHPHAAVGEFGLDRGAVLPGTRLQLPRPARRQRSRQPREWTRTTPPYCGASSYGGSVDLVRGFTCLPGGVGERVYFSFSSVINDRPGPARAKLLARLAAVPLSRLLIESDQNTPGAVDAGLLAILGAAAEARGMGVEEVAQATTANFRRFYGASLAAMAPVAGGAEGRAGSMEGLAAG
ncbi:hypothetical protein TSOC_010501 [Tetrabaena socialis]|uniref:Cut9-interacting protein scn1 n=1 Tax=Tetrabaena socialis TaxID=47790 RepID=A0A2J7ZT34_9CHLO|nr:hypothetical protein TSOC_010501 [Tetrabaena socialis]|eukprot:PNH03434.1 hypothetical protein TSOC_010501 [Tetrabaena socialis]